MSTAEEKVAHAKRTTRGTSAGPSRPFRLLERIEARSPFSSQIRPRADEFRRRIQLTVKYEESQ